MRIVLLTQDDPFFLPRAIQKLHDEMPKDVDWSELGQFEAEDNTVGSQELACLSGVCEIA